MTKTILEITKNAKGLPVTATVSLGTEILFNIELINSIYEVSYLKDSAFYDSFEASTLAEFNFELNRILSVMGYTL